MFHHCWHKSCKKEQENHGDNNLEVSVEEFILEETSEVIQSGDIAMVYTNDE